MNLLIAVASKHGATTEIAEAIARQLQFRGIEVVVRDAEVTESLDGFEALILGSAVYAGRWQPAARALVQRHADRLRAMPVWMFSSGPVGDPLFPQDDAVDVAPLASAANAREHRVFAGKVDRGLLNVGERTVLRLLRAPEGDFRDWDAILRWADSIAADLGVAAGGDDGGA